MTARKETAKGVSPSRAAECEVGCRHIKKPEHLTELLYGLRGLFETYRPGYNLRAHARYADAVFQTLHKLDLDLPKDSGGGEQ